MKISILVECLLQSIKDLNLVTKKVVRRRMEDGVGRDNNQTSRFGKGGYISGDKLVITSPITVQIASRLLVVISMTNKTWSIKGNQQLASQCVDNTRCHYRTLQCCIQNTSINKHKEHQVHITNIAILK